MSNSTATAESLDLEQGSILLAELLAAQAESDAAMARAAVLAGRLAGSGVCERIEGLPLEHLLRLESRLRDSDARFLVSAGEVLEAMPVTAGLLGAGALSWSVVRDIVFQVRSFGAVVRAGIDQRIAATVHQHGDLARLDPEKLLWAVGQAVLDARRTDRVEKSEARVRRSNYVAVQADFDGGIRGHFCFDPVAGAIILSALDDAADAISRAGHDDDDDGDAGDADRDAGDAGDARDAGDDGAQAAGGATADGAGTAGPDTAGHGDADEPDDADDAGAAHDASAGDGSGGGDASDDASDGRGPDTGRGRQLGEALVRLATCWASGGRDAKGRAKPLVVVHVDIADVRVNAAGIVELGVRGALPTITLATLEQLTTDATLRTVLFDGARPLATARKRQAVDIPADTRFAVLARDLGCRFPGSADPTGWCDVHHARHREHGGDHHPDNLLGLSRRFHTISHEHGWTLRVDPRDGAVTATRRGRTYTSLPPGTLLSQARHGPEPPPPPGMPF